VTFYALYIQVKIIFRLKKQSNWSTEIFIPQRKIITLKIFGFDLIWFIVFNAPFSNISAISWQPVLMVEEVGVPGENHRPWTSKQVRTKSGRKHYIDRGTTHTSLSPIRREFAPDFVNCKKGCTRLTAASNKAYQLYVWLIDWFLVFNTTFSNISAISWRPVLVVEEAGVPGENHRPWVSNWLIDQSRVSYVYLVEFINVV
jgi:hypothetical protein